MITSDKIDEWIKEAEERLASGPLIVRFIANRLRDLAERNEELLAENIALMTEKRVQEYEQRIQHLEYQLELLKRQYGGEVSALEAQTAAQAAESTSLLVYGSSGAVLRVELSAAELVDGARLGRLPQELTQASEAARLLAAPSSEELLFLFTSGRISTRPVEELPAAESGETLHQASTLLPDEARAGEKLVCLLPVSRLPLAEYFIQASRKGFTKKIGANMAQSVLANHYIGAGVKQPPDQAFELLLSGKEDRLLLVSRQGYLACLDVRQLPFSIEEGVRLDPSDHLVAAFIAVPGRSLLLMTQVGKAIHRTVDSLETASALRKRGQALLSSQRRAQGVQVIGAAAARESDWAASLHKDGSLALHSLVSVFERGTVPADSELTALATFSPAGVSQ